MKWVIEQKIVTRGLELALLMLSGVSALSYWSLTATVTTATLQTVVLTLAIINSFSLALLGGIYYLLLAATPEKERSASIVCQLLEELNIPVEQPSSNRSIPGDSSQLELLCQTLSDNQQKFKTIAEHSPDIIARFDKKLTYVYVNPAVEKVAGIAAKTFIGKTNRELGMSEELVRQWESILHRIFETGQELEIELQFRKQQETRYFLCRLVPEFAADGSLEFVLGISREITLLKRSLKAPQQGEDVFRKIAEAIPLPMTITRAVDGVVLYTNESFSPTFGLSEQELIGKPIPDFFHDTAERHAFLESLKKTGYLRDYEIKAKKADGTPFWVSGSAQFVKFNGEQAIFGTFYDITERKQIREALQLTQFCIDSAIDPVYWVDSNARFVYVNDAACHSLGYSREELLSMSVFDIDPDLNTLIWQDVWRTLKANGSLRKEACHQAKDGRIFPVEISAKYLEFNGKEYSCSFGRDITERKQAESALRESEARLESILNNSPAAIYLKNINGGYILGNRIEEIKRSLNLEQVIGKTDQELFPKETADRLVWHDQMVLESGKAMEFEEVLPLGEDLRTYVSIKFPVYDTAGRLWGVGGISSDITERRQAERALKTSEERFQIALKNAPIIVFNQDTDLRYTWVYNTNLGFNAEALVGKLESEVMSPEDAQRLTQIKQPVIATGVGERVETFVTLQEEVRYWDMTVEPLRDQAGEIVGITCAATDITEVRVREQQLRAIFEGALDAITITDNHGTFVEANPAACQLFGLPHSQLVGCQIANFIEPDFDGQQAWHEFLNQRQETGELRLLRPDGTIREIEYAATANFIPGRHLSVLRDITERKQAEAALRESEARFHSMADSAPVLIWMSDADLLCTFFNQPWLNFSGRNLEAEKGNGWLEGVHPEDLQYCLDTYLSAAQKGELYTVEFRLRRADGEYRWVLNTGVPRFTNAGNFEGYIGCCIDITERREAEEERRRSEARYRAIVEDQTELICRFRPDGTMTFVNDAYCRYVRQPRQEMIGRSFCPMILAKDPENMEKLLAVLSRENPVVMSEEYVSLPNMESRWLQWITRAIFSEEGDLIEYQAVGRNITLRKRAEEALRESQRLIQQIADTAPNHLYIYDLTQDCEIYTNRQLEEFLGYTAAELQAMGSQFLAEFLHPEDLSAVEEFNQRFATAKDDEVIESEHRLKNAQGEWCWFHSWEVVFTRTPEGLPRQILGTSIDITERKQAESALQASEEQLRVALEAAGMSTWEWNILTDEFKWTANSQLFWDIAANSFDGRYETFIESLHPSDRRRVLLEVERAVQEGKNHEIEFRVISPDGTIRWVASKGQVFYNEAGNPVRMVGVDRDITQHKQAEEAVEKSEELYRTMARNFPNGVVLLFDRNLRYTLAEGKGLSEFGLAKELIEGKVIEEVFPPEISKVKEPADRAALTGKATVFEMAYGEQIYLVHVLPVKNEQGEIFAGMAMWQNISDRKRAELALLEERNFVAAILDTANALIVVLDRQGRIVRFNRTCEQITDYSFEEVKDRYVWEMFLLPEDIDSVKIVVEELQAGQFPNENINYWVMRDGSRRLISWSNTVLLEADGSVKYIICIGIDITERQKAEEVSRALEREQELSALRLRFFSMASHEFRTPLSTILMSTQLLASCSENWSDDKRQRNLRRIESATKNMIQLLEDILTINRAETGKLEFNPTSLNLEQFCFYLVEEMQFSAGPGRSIIFDIRGECQNAYADQKLLRCIITNLLSNAIKYSPQDSQIIFLIVIEQGNANFRIQDQGIGIPMSDQPHLFEAFHRGGNIDNIHGTGLGLTVVKNCVELHGGSITLESEVGVGTTFTLTIPIQKA
ncbi:PAS domain S-box protein [Lyngbya aestuarii]|uniref:PAS domain S-box protein n=1 Tax=Lyngbya aestuarii TaxID=118322 RepID=UPI00403D805E